MATVIDALVVTLGMDLSLFKKGQKDAGDSTKKFASEQEASAKKVVAQAKVMTDGFRSVRNELLGLFAIAVGANGFKDFITSQVKGQAALGYTAKNLSMSARDLDAWGKTVKTVGGTAEGFQSSLQGIASGIEAFKLGEDSPVVSMFRSIGVNIGDAAGKVRPFQDMLLDVADALQRFDAQDQIRIGQGLGIDSDTLNLLRQGRGAVQALYDQMYKASGVTEESTKRAQEAQRVWGEFTGQVSGVGQSVFEALVPALIEATGKLKDFGVWVNENRAEIGDFFKGLVDGGERVAKMFSNISGDDTASKLNTITASLVALGAALAVIAGGGGISALARLGVVGAVGGAGYAGWKAGEQINDAFIKGTPAEELIGSTVAHGMALLGSKEAQDAIDQTEGGRKENPTQSAIGSFVAHSLALLGNKEAQTAVGITDLEENKGTAEYVKKYFTSQGWTEEQASGIAANLSAESNFKPSAYGDAGRAYGIAQWHGDRQQEFQKQYGKSIHGSSLEEQLAFVQYELTQGNEVSAGRKLKAASTAREAGQIVSKHYERPAKQEWDAQRRGELAVMLSTGAGGSVAPLPVGASANKEIATSTKTINNTSEVHINQITVQTQATDAPGIAGSMKEAINQNGLVTASATGMN